LTPVLITAFDAYAVEEGIALSWSVFADEDIDGFRVYRSDGNGTVERLIHDRVIESTARTFVDQTALYGRRYVYTLVTLVAAGNEIRSAPVEVMRPAPTKTLLQNVPNPFNPATAIRYEIVETVPVSLRIYDVRGALVRVLFEGQRPPGRYKEAWNGVSDRGDRVASGVYFYRLTTPGFKQTKKMVLLK
jgi:hypothetical protein